MRRRVNIQKAAVYSIVINAIQIVAVIGIAILVLVTDIEQSSVLFVEAIICLAALLIIWGAVIDITQALDAQRVTEQSAMLEEAYGQLEALNTTLRAQRHDFMNHLQVVYSLIEMGEHHEASEYIERVYGDIQAVSTILRTSNPAVNALLKVKLGECQKRGIAVETRVQSKWNQLPVPGWEMCRVLGNLIDNAMDAMKETREARMIITLGEDERCYFFQVENNGPRVPEALQETIFHPGITTKGEGHGMGLAIVRHILTEHRGDITLESAQDKTVFFGWMLKEEPPADEQTPAATVDMRANAAREGMRLPKHA